MFIWRFRVLLEYATKYPDGWRAEVQLAYLNNMFASANSDPKKGKPLKAEQFSTVLAGFRKEKQKPHGQASLAALTNLARPVE